MDTRIEHRNERLEHDRPDARMALGEHVGAQQHHCACLRHAERCANAARMRSDEVHLQRAQVFVLDPDVAELSKPGVDSVDGISLEQDLVDDPSRSVHPIDDTLGEADDLAIRDVAHLVERERCSVERDHR